jgi:hypothetical protein
MKIYFYIRSLYKDSIGVKENKRNQKSVEFFNSLSPITVQEYRNHIHEIQLKCLYKISSNIIYNTPCFDLNSYTCPYHNVQSSAQQQILELNDDDILIPLDDDDWLSPEISKIEFYKNSLTIWNTVSLNKDKLFYYKMPHVFQQNEEYTDKKGIVFSNCIAISANIVKNLIKEKKDSYNLPLQNLLQFHTHTRQAIREDVFNQQPITENVIEKYYAVYVKHMCNDSRFLTHFKEDTEHTLQNYNNLINEAKQLVYTNIPLSEEYEWCKEYLNDVQNLNNLFYNV